MKAIVQDRYGSADGLHLRGLDTPAIGDRDVLVRVRASAVHAGDWHMMTGLPYLIRFMGFGIRRPKVAVRGSDVAGVVAAVGKDVRQLRPGDEVFGWCDGSLAEYARAPEGNFLPKPARLTFEQAAAVPISGIAALQGLRDSGRLKSGQR